MHTLTYTFDEDYYGIYIINPEFQYCINENFEDYFEFMFEKKYNIKYRENAWMLEKDAYQYYSELKKKWYEDEEFNQSLYNLYEYNEEFKSYLKSKYREDALQEAAKDDIDDAIDFYKSLAHSDCMY